MGFGAGMVRQVRLLAHLDQLEAAGVVFRMSKACSETGKPLPVGYIPHAGNWADWISEFCIIPPADGSMEAWVQRVLTDDEYYEDLYEGLKVRELGYGWWVVVHGDGEPGTEDHDWDEADWD